MRPLLRVLSAGPLALALAAALACGCGQRPRANPFDPANPVTGGRPAGFVALAGNGQVELEWQPAVSAGLVGYQLFRKLVTDTTYAAITGTIPADASRIGDFQLANGIEHDYRLYYVFDRGLGNLPAEDFATPGPLEPWVADFGRSALARMTADGRHIESWQPFGTVSAGTGSPIDVASDPSNGLVWVSCSFGPLVVYTPATGNRVNITRLSSPGALALDPVDGTAWVCDDVDQSLYHFSNSGAVASPGQLAPLENPLDVAVDPGDRSVWVCERDGNRVTRFAADGSGRAAATLLAPSRVAVDSLTHEVWATSFSRGRVYRLTNTPALSDSFTIAAGPVGVAVDGGRGRIWVADATGGSVFALHRNGSVEFQISGLATPREIQVDRASGEAWVTLLNPGRLARLSPTGKVLTVTGGFDQPAGLSIGAGP
jgi:DNA-binding beta-propeller fold protein YncE